MYFGDPCRTFILCLREWRDVLVIGWLPLNIYLIICTKKKIPSFTLLIQASGIGFRLDSWYFYVCTLYWRKNKILTILYYPNRVAARHGHSLVIWPTWYLWQGWCHHQWVMIRWVIPIDGWDRLMGEVSYHFFTNELSNKENIFFAPGPK